MQMATRTRKQSGWMEVTEQLDSRFRFEPANLENSDPELCIKLFKESDNLNFHGLKKRITSADKEWVKEFLLQDGLEILFKALGTLGTKGFDTSTAIMDAVQQLECIGCIKAIMSRSCGMEYILMNGEDFVKRLIEELKSNNGLLKIQVYQLLTCLCMYSNEGYTGQGYKLLTTALQHYKKVNGERHRFSVLIKDLRKAETDQYCNEVLTFINCLLACCDNAEERSSIRDDLAALNLMGILVKWRNTEDEELATQLDVFDAEFVVDEKVMMTEEGLDISNHRNVFRAIHKKVAGTPNALSFLHILQHLMLLDKDSKKCNMVWEMLEKIVMSAVMMSEGNQAAADHFVSASTEKIKKALAQFVNGSVPEMDSKVVPPPLPPPGGISPPAAPNVPTPSPNEAPLTNNTLSPILAASFAFRPPQQMRILNWKKLQQNTIKKNQLALWKKESIAANSLAINGDQIVELFSQVEFVSKTICKQQQAKEPSVVNLFDNMTTLDINIFLKQFTNIKEVLDILKQSDTKRISFDQMKAFENILPAQSMIDILTSYTGNPEDLGDAEKFLLQLIKVERYDLRIQGMLLQLEFPKRKGELEPALKAFCDAVDEILNSESLKDLFYIILVVGNMINAGSRSGCAYGFAVNSLDTLENTRTNQPRMTFMHYVVSICEVQFPKLLHTMDELPNLKPSTRWSVDYFAREVVELQTMLKETGSKMTEAPEDFKKQMDEFIETADKEISKLSDSVDDLNGKLEKIAEFFCEDKQKFKIEKLLSRLLKFIEQLPTLAKENTQQELIEKKRAEKRQKKLKKKKKLDNRPIDEVDGPVDTVDGPVDTVDGPEEEEDIIGNLMEEIREGKALRRCSEAQSSGATQPSRHARELNQNDILSMQKAYEKSFTELIKEESEDKTDSGQVNDGDKKP